METLGPLLTPGESIIIQVLVFILVGKFHIKKKSRKSFSWGSHGLLRAMTCSFPQGQSHEVTWWGNTGINGKVESQGGRVTALEAE